MAPKATQHEEQRRLDALIAGRAAGVSNAEIARRLGLRPNTLNMWLSGRDLPPIEENIAAPAVFDAPAAPTPLEVRDAAFWRAKATLAEKEARDAEHFAKCLAGVRDVPIEPEAFPEELPDARASRSIAIIHTSDLHAGETVTRDETHGINEYNPEIAKRRMAQLFTAACEIGPRWMVGTRCIGALLTMGGDLISGDIHEELAQTNALTSHESVKLVVQIYDAGIRRLLETFGRVHVVAVPGNHGRTTQKPPPQAARRAVLRHSGRRHAA